MNKRLVGATVVGLRAPVFKEGDDLVTIASDTLLDYLAPDGRQGGRRGCACDYESVVARTQGNMFL